MYNISRLTADICLLMQLLQGKDDVTGEPLTQREDDKVDFNHIILPELIINPYEHAVKLTQAFLWL